MHSHEWPLGLTLGDEAPGLPGVYHFLDESGALIYVGKAQNLKRRLAQYRPTKSRKKKHRRVKRIVAAARTVRIFVTASHLDACLKEVRDIQTLKPRLNVTSTFSSHYPFVGMRRVDDEVRFGFTTKSEELDGYTLHGAFRSRDVVAEAFFSLMRLFTRVGHRTKLPKGERPKSRYTSIHVFRRLPSGYESEWSRFLKGETREPLEALVLHLLESTDARYRSSETQEEIDAIRRFWEAECRPLAAAIADAGYEGPYPVPQTARDPLFVRSKFLNAPGTQESMIPQVVRSDSEGACHASEARSKSASGTT